MKIINKKITAKFFAALIAVLLLAAYFSFVSIPQSARADDTDAVEYQTTVIDITNGNFAESESGYPAAPTGWTGEYLDKSTGGVTHGVIDLSPGAIKDNVLKDDYKLTEYDEYKSSIPHYKYEHEEEGKVLLINSPNTEVAYGYKSNSISLSKNSYYEISVWAKTSSNARAYVKLAKPDGGGLKNAIAFSEVSTFNYHGDDFSAVNNNSEADFGWVKYSFFIETSTLSDTSVNLSLQLGDYTEWTDEDGKTMSHMDTSKGYVMFDNATILQHSPDLFRFLINDFDKDSGKKNSIASDNYRFFYTEHNKPEETKIFYSECDAVDLSIKDGKLLGLESDEASISPDFGKYNIGSFDNNYWEPADESASGTGNTFRLGARTSKDSNLGILKNNEIPFAPDGNDNSIAFLSSYSVNHEDFDPDCYGVASPEFSLTRHKFYKLSVWVKSLNEDAANVVIRGEDYRGPDSYYQKNQLYYSSGLKGLSDGVESRNGWTEVSFFFEGSSFADYSVHVELWLGIGEAIDNDGNAVSRQTVKGAAMFDNLRIEELTSAEFTNYSGSGTTVTFDKGNDGSTGFANPTFDKVGDYTTYEYPLAPKSWTYSEVSDNAVSGMSKDRVVAYNDSLVDQDDWDDLIVRGIIPTDSEHFAANQTVNGIAKYGGLTENPGSADNVIETHGSGNNALLLSSPSTKVAVGYSSSTVSITAGTTYTIDIAMKAFNMSGYGANLVLRKGEYIVSTIEKIGIDVGRDREWETYSFYVQGGDSDVGDLSVEIWLGLYDKEKNITKLGAGTIVIDSINLTQHEEGSDSVYSNMYARYLIGADNGMYGVYSFSGADFSAFDRYSDSFIKPSYDYSASGSNVSFGVFDSSKVTEGNGYLWDGYKNQNAAGYKHKLYLSNDYATHSKVTTNFRRTVSGNAYYKLTFTIKVNIPTAQSNSNVQYQGAYVGIKSGETEYLIHDIKNTSEIYDVANPTSGDREYFRDYSIYIKGVASDDESDDINVVFGIGGEAANQQSRGKLIIANISFATSNDVDYLDAKEAIEAVGSRQSRTSLTVSFAEEEDEDKDDDNTSSTVSNLSVGQSWLVVSGIILAVAIIVAIVAFSVRYLARKRRATAGHTGSTTYDRKSTLILQHNKRAGSGDNIVFDADSYESFDEAAEYEYQKEQAALKLAKASELSKTAEEPGAEFEEAVMPAAETVTETVTAEASPAADETVAVEAKEELPTEEAEAAEPEEINYDEVVEFKAPEFVPVKKEETLEEAIEKAKLQPDEIEEKPVIVNNWDTFED